MWPGLRGVGEREGVPQLPRGHHFRSPEKASLYPDHLLCHHQRVFLFGRDRSDMGVGRGSKPGLLTASVLVLRGAHGPRLDITGQTQMLDVSALEEETCFFQISSLSQAPGGHTFGGHHSTPCSPGAV